MNDDMMIDWIAQRLSTKTDYHPSHKYAIVEFHNGLDEVWYRIRRIGFWWNSWYRTYFETDYGWTGTIAEFATQEQATNHLNREKEKYLTKQKRNQIRMIKS
jgi:hypothetical protein